MQIVMCVNERTLAEMIRSWFSKKEKEMIRSLDGMCSRWYTTNGLYPYNFIISFSVIGSSCQGYYFFSQLSHKQNDPHILLKKKKKKKNP